MAACSSTSTLPLGQGSDGLRSFDGLRDADRRAAQKRRSTCSLGFKPTLSKRADCRSPADGGVRAGGGRCREDEKQRSHHRTACCWIRPALHQSTRLGTVTAGLVKRERRSSDKQQPDVSAAARSIRQRAMTQAMSCSPIWTSRATTSPMGRVVSISCVHVARSSGSTSARWRRMSSRWSDVLPYGFEACCRCDSKEPLPEHFRAQPRRSANRSGPGLRPCRRHTASAPRQ
jgi:hypothetical protein